MNFLGLGWSPRGNPRNEKNISEHGFRAARNFALGPVVYTSSPTAMPPTRGSSVTLYSPWTTPRLSRNYETRIANPPSGEVLPVRIARSGAGADLTWNSARVKLSMTKSSKSKNQLSNNYSTAETGSPAREAK